MDPTWGLNSQPLDQESCAYSTDWAIQAPWDLGILHLLGGDEDEPSSLHLEASMCIFFFFFFSWEVMSHILP